MEKSSYRRTNHYKSRTKKTARPRSARNRKENTGFDFKQMLLIQCIVSGIILICVLLISIINVPVTNSLRHNLKVAINSNVTRESVEESTIAVTGKFTGLQTVIKNIFGSGEQSNDQDLQPLIQDTANTLGEEVMDVFSSQSEPSAFRIDEDILNQLHGDAALYGTAGEDGSEKKSEVPVE